MHVHSTTVLDAEAHEVSHHGAEWQAASRVDLEATVWLVHIEFESKNVRNECEHADRHGLKL